MDESLDSHLAKIDGEGNIILPEGEWVTIDTPRQSRHGAKNLEQNLYTEPPAPLWVESNETEAAEPVQHIWSEVRSSAMQTTNAFLKEGVLQYEWSARSSAEVIKDSIKSLRTKLSKLGKFLIQPVWIVRPNRKPKEYNRTTLFLLDTVRFGGTFAAIFLLLFVTLNASSFWAIAKEKIDPIQAAQDAKLQQLTMDSTLKEKLLRSPSLSVAGREDGNLLSFLPPVGPPENRLIIPKLGINVPLVTPSYQALLSEDWEQVEHDIQDALQMGVVHYPGTARPGQAGNFFVTGHSSYYPWAPGDYKNVFARLHNLDIGDEYFVYYGGDEHRYIIRDKEEVKPSNVHVLDQPIDQRVGTLMTCTPVGTTLRRLILTADEVDPVSGVVLKVGEQEHREEADFAPQMLPI